jgi:hypothetical protein
MSDALKPLRERTSRHELMQKRYSDQIVVLDRQFEEEFAKYWPKGTPLPQETIDKSKALRKEYDAKKASLEAKADNEGAASRQLQRDVEAAGAECPAAMKAVQ